MVLQYADINGNCRAGRDYLRNSSLKQLTLQQFMKQFMKDVVDTFHSQTFYAGLVRRGKGIGVKFVFLEIMLTLITCSGPQ